MEACAVMGIDTQSITRDDKNVSQCNGTPAHQGCFRQPGRSYEMVSSRHTVLGCDSEKRAIVPGSRSEFSRVVEWLESAHIQIPNTICTGVDGKDFPRWNSEILTRRVQVIRRKFFRQSEPLERVDED